MRILIYGAGVIGCTLAHSLHRGGNEVTLFARGNWKKVIEEKPRLEIVDFKTELLLHV